MKDAVPLRDAVDAFNREHAAAAAEIGQPPLSPREIAEAYRKYEWGRERRSPDAGAADERETAAWERFSAVVRDRILPPGVSLRPRLTPRRTDDAKTIVDYQVDLIFAEPDRDVPVGFILRQAKGVRPATDEETVRGPELDGGYAAFNPVANVAAAPAEGDTAPESIPVESVDPAPGEPVTMWENTIVGVNLGADGPAREIASADESVCLAVPDRDNDALVVVRATGPGTTTVTYTAAKTGPGRFRVTVRPAEELEAGAEPLADPVGPTLAEAVVNFNATFGKLTGGPPVTAEELRAALERDVEAADTVYADRLAEDADYRETVETLRTALATGRLTPEAVLIYSVDQGTNPPTQMIDLRQPFEDSYVTTRVRGGLSGAVRERIAAALAAAAADDDLPVETRLTLLRETAAPGSLTAGQTAWLFAALAETARESAAAEDAENDFDDDGNRLSLNRRFFDLLTTMATFEVAAPDAATARTLAGYVFQSARRDAGDSPAAKVLKNTAATAAGLRVLLDAAAVPGPAAEPEPEGRRRTDWLGARPPTPAERHARTTAALLDAVRAARPTTDEAAQVLLEAAASDNPGVRAAAVEALAGAGG